MTVTFGLVGCGRISERHVRTLSQCPEARLVAVSDIVAERMESIEELHRQTRGGTLTKFADYRDLLIRSDIDAVIITAVSGLHGELAKAALRAGKHVVVEKPMALSLQDADEIIRLSDERRLQVLVCHQFRYHPLMRKVKNVVERGMLGKMVLGSVSIRLHRPASYFASAPWRGTWKMDGGILLNQGIHLIDLLLWFLGDVKQAYGELAKGNLSKETEDAALGILRFESGALGMVEATIAAYPNNMGQTLTLFGEQGTLSIGGGHLEQIIRWSVVDRSDSALPDTEAAENEHVSMYKDLLRTLMSGGSVLMNAREGKKALETIFAIYRSFLVEAPVPLPLSRFSTEEMLAKFRAGNS